MLRKVARVHKANQLIALLVHISTLSNQLIAFTTQGIAPLVEFVAMAHA